MNRSLLRCCTYTVFAFLLSCGILKSQDWREPLADTTVTFYQVQADFYQRWGLIEQQIYQSRQDNAQTHNKFANPNAVITPMPSTKGGYKQFKRWEYRMEPRVYPSGDLTLPSTTYERFQDYLNSNPAAMQQYQQGQGNSTHRIGPGNNSIMSSTWTFAGPTGAPTGGGAGRINFIRFDHTNSNTIWVGAPDGGLWKSTNGGTSWTTNTDLLTVIGATDVAIDPTNTQTMYLATGDGDAGDSYSIGVLKSTDGGNTWNTTGLTWTVNQGRTISKLLINPSNPLIVMAFTSNGIYRTTNGGTAWTQVQNTNSFKDAEYKPGDPNTVYAAGTRFWKSTDGGATWTNTATGLPANTAVDRFAIAVSQDATGTAYVYILAGSAANDGFYGFYRSTDSGATFTSRSTTPNVLGWASAGNDTGGQGWYDLAVAASPINKDIVIVGGVNIWRSTNGGTNWTLNGHWTGTGAPYVHADVHALEFLPGNGTTYFAGCDGGVFKTTNSGGAWADLSNNLCIAQMYRIGLSASNPTLWITGHQDNGTNLKNGANYTSTLGGDGMDCFIDRTNNNVMYGEYYNGAFNRTTNGGANWTAITTGLTGTAPWVTAWYQDPATANTIYCGRTNMFKSTNQGTSWTQLTALPTTPSGTVVDFKVAPSNNQIIYVARAGGLFKTTNGGTSWTTVTGTLPVGSAAISRVDVKPNDPNTVYVTFSGYSSGNKVFKTTNGGTSWTNISTGLPNLPVNCVRFDPSSITEAVYVGCDVGVYYMDNTFTSWQPYFTGLPNCSVDDLEVYSPTGKLRAATFGRGVWEVDIYNPGTLAPIADFTSNKTIICPGVPVNFTDLSSFTPTSWSWTFQGGTPATSTAQNPTGITWSTAGTYSVTLTSTNGNGSDAEVKTAYITVLGSTVPPLVEGFQSTFLPAGWTANNINNDGVFWTQAATGFSSTQSAMFDNYNNDVAGARDEMWAPRLNTTGYTSLSMTFDVAYARYDATYSDTLEVVLSTDCGTTWNSVYLKGGTTLATAPDNTNAFTPTAAQWRNESVSLNAYAGQASIIIAVRNRGRYGNIIYVDNINITGAASALPSATFTASATTVCVGATVNFTDASTNNPTSWTWTFPSGTPASATTQNVTGVTWAAAGTYTVTHTATNVSGTGTTTQVITVNALPTVTTSATSTTICSGNPTTITASGATTYTWMPGSLTGTSITVSPTTTTTYTVTGTNANGCVNTATRTITVNPTPTVTISPSSATICSGNSTTLTASGATTYTWMPGSLTGTTVTVSPATTTTYTVTGTSAGCTATSTQLITVNPTPTVTTSATSTTICAGSPTTITASGATTYTWMPGSLTGTSITVSPATTTTYTVTGTSAGCTGTATRLITVNPSPTVTVSASSTGICTGGNTTLTASGATTYSWMPGSLTGTSVTVSPTTTTTYTVTGTSAGCTNTATILITVTPTPTVTTSATSTTICAGSPTTITASGATTYTWMPGSLTGTSITVSPATTTTYTVTGTSGGCSGTATRLITVNPSPTVTVSASNATICSGNSTTLTANGATTYTWMPGSLTGTTVTVSPTVTTTYTVTGTAAGCTNTATQLITVNPTPTVTTSATSTTICSGNSTTITASGATTYTWMPGSLTGTSVTVSPTTTTTYTVTGTSAGCSGTATRLITVNPSPTVTTTTSGATICSGNSTTITASGGTSYTWMPGSLTGTTVTVSPTTTTTYTVTGTAANGCTNTATRTITVNPSPTVTVSASSTSICTGNTVTLTATGASTYTWMPGSLTGTSVTVTPAVTTTYTITGTAANGCTNVFTITINVGAQPTVTASASSSTICSGNSTTLTAAGATTYTWMPGSLTGTSVTVSPATTTTYTVTGTVGAGCTNTGTVLVTVNPTPTVTTSASSTTICAGSPTTITASGASTYSWMPGSLTGTSVTVSPATTTTYTVTGTAANGCVNTSTRLITVNPSPTVTASASNATICAGSPTTITASGATTYTWMPGSLTGTSVTVSPATTTTYTVTGTDGNGCTNTSTQLITVNPSPVITATATLTTICSGGSVTLSASGGSTYTWQPGNLTGSSVTVTPASTTTYTVTGVDANGCSNTATQTITIGPGPTVTATASAATICPGGTTTLTASGASTYVWQPGNLTGSSVTVSPAVSTTYTVTGTDVNGCVSTATQSIVVGPGLNVTATASSATICDGSTVTLTGSGATTYTWQPGNLTGTTVTDAPTTTTTYTVTGTDPSGCFNTATVVVTVNASPTITATSSSNIICAGNTVQLDASGAGGYNWMPGNLSGDTVTVIPSSTTTYTVSGIDANGCTSTATVLVTVSNGPAVLATSSNSGVCVGNSVTLTGSGASTYVWQPGNLTGTTVVTTPAITTTYTVTGTDVNGCTNVDTITVSVYSQPVVFVSGSNVICLGDSVTLTGNGASTYAWQPGGQTTISITETPTSTTTYTVTGTDVFGCFSTTSYIVTVNTPPATPSILVNGSTLTSSVTGASYQWYLNGNPIPGATGQSYNATQSGSYTVEVFDAAGCASAQSGPVIDPTGIETSNDGTSSISVYPNPNDGHFVMTIEINQVDNYVLEIHNALGQVIYSEALDNFKGTYNKEVDLSVHARGVYTIRLKSAVHQTIIKTVTY